MARDPDATRRRRITDKQARGGRIVLNTPARRAIFAGGLIGLVIVLLVVFFASA